VCVCVAVRLLMSCDLYFMIVCEALSIPKAMHPTTTHNSRVSVCYELLRYTDGPEKQSQRTKAD
jgi:hypothetical protein